MKTSHSEIDITAVSDANSNTYLELGIRSYKQHYLHLWENADPTPYISENFTEEIIAKELQSDLLRHYIVKRNSMPAGIFKLVLNAAIGEYKSDEALLIEKIYLLGEYSGQGLGKVCLDFVFKEAKKLNKKLVWLDTMKNGRALDFYLNSGFQVTAEKELSYPSVLEEQKPMLILSHQL